MTTVTSDLLPFYVTSILLVIVLLIGFLPGVRSMMADEEPGASLSLIRWSIALVLAQAAIYLYFV